MAAQCDPLRKPENRASNGRRYECEDQAIRGICDRPPEQTRDRIWTELQRMGECWEEQKTYIEHQQTYIRDLEQTRDRLWDEVRTNEQLRNQQSSQVHQLQAECERLQVEVASRFSKRVAQFAQRVWRREKNTPSY